MYLRQKEMGIFLALGEKRKNIIIQLLIETLMIAFIGTMLAILIFLFGNDVNYYNLSNYYSIIFYVTRLFGLLVMWCAITKHSKTIMIKNERVVKPITMHLGIV
ncbi:MAG: ABC transporter permease, partial [Breznakia sp.]